MIYEYHCDKCNEVFEEFECVAKCKEPKPCPTCKELANRQISAGVMANTGSGSRIPGVCDLLPGKAVYIKSKNHFKEECKKHGCTPVAL